MPAYGGISRRVTQARVFFLLRVLELTLYLARILPRSASCQLVLQLSSTSRTHYLSRANLAVILLGRFVREVNVDQQQSSGMVFNDGSEIMVSLRPEHYDGPKAVDFQGRNNQRAMI